VYLLVPAKGGAKLQASEMQGEQARGTMRVGRGTVTAQAIPLSWLARQLAQVLGRDVIDKTGLAGNFDFELAWTPEPGQGGGSSLGGPQTTGPMPAADLSGPSLFGALQEQLGLRLEAARGPVQVYVVDRIARPGEN
jgi:uncharacterized protein (TIGR03435 family)